jgi:MFS transporter, PAT family, beta-lactamase induction signal transducer AmpG
MALTRALTGPLAGILIAALGWRDFFILTVPTGLPALLLLQRFVPWGVRDPQFSTETSRGV